EAEAQRVARAVEHAFWPAGGDGLADVVGPEGRPDFAVRPNQIFALSLPYPLVPPERAAAVLAAVERDLLTPYGLRSLAPGHPSYTGVYEGPRPVRDAAYHQGTVWSWLIGPFVDATLRVRGATPETAEALRQALDPLVDHVRGQAGLGSVSEIFDGDAPHTPRGCIAQAWSVAELLRALWTLSHLGGD
ncbi:MAG: glycogen debranching protein, partial [Candidatus Sumerlaeia bacterium]|nr:glycogen debranching protein [Candidatus Sumerlaeia bacterium]